MEKGTQPNLVATELVLGEDNFSEAGEVARPESSYPMLNTHFLPSQEYNTAIARDAITIARQATLRCEDELERILVDKGRVDPLTSARFREMNWLHPQFDIGTVRGIWKSDNIEEDLKELVKPSLWARGTDTYSIVIIERQPRIFELFTNTLAEDYEDARSSIDPEIYPEALKSLRSICSEEARKNGIRLMQPIGGSNTLPRGLKAWVADRLQKPKKSHK